MFCCPRCGGRFFQVLEVRVHPHSTCQKINPSNNQPKSNYFTTTLKRTAFNKPNLPSPRLAPGDVLLTKRRCKRCKFKLITGRQFENNQLFQVDYTLWQASIKLNTYLQSKSSKATIICSAYSKKTAKPVSTLTPFQKYSIRYKENALQESLTFD
jgi:hypothetical protein